MWILVVIIIEIISALIAVGIYINFGSILFAIIAFIVAGVCLTGLVAVALGRLSI